MPRYLLRHATPLIDTALCYGRLNVPAHRGHTQAAAIAAASILQDPHITLMCSPLLRCQQLGQALQTTLQAHGQQTTWHTVPSLQEMHFGVWEGQPWSQVTPAEWRAWMQHFTHYRAGTTGESVLALLERVYHLWQQPVQGTEVWITHAGVIRAVQLFEQGYQPQHLIKAKQWPQTSCGYGQWHLCQ